MHQKITSDKRHGSSILWEWSAKTNLRLTARIQVSASVNSDLLKLCRAAGCKHFWVYQGLLTQLSLITRTVQTFSNQKYVVILVYSCFAYFVALHKVAVVNSPSTLFFSPHNTLIKKYNQSKAYFSLGMGENMSPSLLKILFLSPSHLYFQVDFLTEVSLLSSCHSPDERRFELIKFVIPSSHLQLLPYTHSKWA